MSGKVSKPWLLRGLKLALVPLCLVLFFLACPWFRGFVASQFQTHPLWSAFILATLCLVAGICFVGARVTNSELGNQYRDVGLIAFLCLLVLGLGIVFVDAAVVFSAAEFKAAAFRSAALWALAYSMSGFLVGFLFGIPKVLQQDDSEGRNPRSYAQRVNTNLEQISDWLTKIIVGLGLVELKQVPAYLERASRWMAHCLAGDEPTVAVVSFATSIILFFSIVGFLAGYLITRLFLAGAFGRADQRVQEEHRSKIAESPDALTLGDRIRNYWSPGGIVDADHESRLRAWMAQNGLESYLTSELLNADDLQKYRQKIVADLSIP